VINLSPQQPETKLKAILFSGSVILGVVFWFYIFGEAWFSTSIEPILVKVVLLGCGGGFVTGAICSFREPQHRLVWSVGFAVPMVAWGTFCLILTPFNDIGLLWWPAFGLVMALSAFIGGFLGRLFRQKF